MTLISDKIRAGHTGIKDIRMIRFFQQIELRTCRTKLKLSGEALIRFPEWDLIALSLPLLQECR